MISKLEINWVKGMITTGLAYLIAFGIIHKEWRVRSFLIGAGIFIVVTLLVQLIYKLFLIYLYKKRKDDNDGV
mgnify:FL=1